MLQPCTGAAHALQVTEESGWHDTCRQIMECIITHFNRSDAAAALLLALVWEQVSPAVIIMVCCVLWPCTVALFHALRTRQLSCMLFSSAGFKAWCSHCPAGPGCCGNPDRCAHP